MSVLNERAGEELRQPCAWRWRQSLGEVRRGGRVSVTRGSEGTQVRVEILVKGKIRHGSGEAPGGCFFVSTLLGNHRRIPQPEKVGALNMCIVNLFL